jgi:hypothetical protein
VVESAIVGPPPVRKKIAPKLLILWLKDMINKGAVWYKTRGRVIFLVI